ncbi:acetoacetate decarboxylase family protein [Corallococcus llansteffanensis]|uniref:Acetoacetate decarboxylase n=1 Tax=Corallococcus llansteffanensis TaxID=2316731 RepID=A0A3A8PT24_9BACT|nr:acetoacetate decarboxylase family protein [Corallococcus llansteffanensis]RKH59543.1 acetoacetate decarboxylase [Corallococcus llansteffanensis]
MFIPKRIKKQAGRYSRVDDIPYALPVDSKGAPVMMAAFTVDARRAASLLPGNELHPLRVTRDRSVLLITVIDYHVTDIGAYIEFSIALACTHGLRPAPPLLPLLFSKRYGVGQYVVDLPVNTEVSVKGGKGIWGMPKHLARLDFRVEDGTVSSRYVEGGQLAVHVGIERPKRAWLPLRAAAVNYCAFRGLLMKSSIYFRGKFGFRLGRWAKADLKLGDHPRVRPLKELGISDRPLFTGFFPSSSGVLDDHFEAWFLTQPSLPESTYPEGLESVVDLGQGQTPMPPPDAAGAPSATVQGVWP